MEVRVTMIVQCCVCNKVRDAQGEWVTPAEKIDREQASHGYCPACAADAFAEIQRWVEKRSRARSSAA